MSSPKYMIAETEIRVLEDRGEAGFAIHITGRDAERYASLREEAIQSGNYAIETPAEGHQPTH